MKDYIAKTIENIEADIADLETLRDGLKARFGCAAATKKDPPQVAAPAPATPRAAKKPPRKAT